MKRRLAAIPILLAVTFATAAAPEDRPAPPPARTDGTRPQHPWVGFWVSEADPQGAIQIGKGSLDFMWVAAFQKLDAAGTYDDGVFMGLCRQPQDPRIAHGPFTYTVLKLRGLSDTTLVAEYSAAPGGTPVRSERWRRSDRSRTERAAAGMVVDTTGLPRVGDYVYVEELPEAIQKVPPEYPASARARSISGTVMLQVLVGKDGTVKDTRVVKSIPELDEAAAAAVRKWRFKPALSKGSPVAVWVAVPVKFSLH